MFLYEAFSQTADHQPVLRANWRHLLPANFWAGKLAQQLSVDTPTVLSLPSTITQSYSSPGHSAQLLSCRQSHEYNSERSSTTWPHRHRVSNNFSPNYFVSNLSNFLSFRLFKQNKSRSWNLGDMLLGLKLFQCSLLLCIQKQTLTSLSFTSRFVCIRSDKVVISQSLFIQLTINYTKAIPESLLETWFLIKPSNREKYKQRTISALFKKTVSQTKCTLFFLSLSSWNMQQPIFTTTVTAAAFQQSVLPLFRHVAVQFWTGAAVLPYLEQR